MVRIMSVSYTHLFKSYLANVTSFSLEVILPLGFMAIGIAIGIVISAKSVSYTHLDRFP